MNIKNEEAHTLARALCEATGETLTAAVTEALRERLERVRKERGQRLARLLAIAKEAAPHFKEPYVDHADLLYDDLGLPK